MYVVLMAAVECGALNVGCASLGPAVERAGAPENAPSPGEILADLAANDNAIQSFRAGGTFTLESPKLESTQRFRGGRILFRRPADLYVQGNHRVTNMAIFKLYCAGEEFLMEFPTQQEQSFYQFEGEQFEDVPFSVSPSDIAREMFLPEDWDALASGGVTLAKYDAGHGTATLEVRSAAGASRVIDVVRVAGEAPGWAISRNERRDETGRTLAVTTLGDYRAYESVRFPSSVEAWFPTEETRMTIEIRTVQFNGEIEDKYFDLRARAAELGLMTAGTR